MVRPVLPGSWLAGKGLDVLELNCPVGGRGGLEMPLSRGRPTSLEFALSTGCTFPLDIHHEPPAHSLPTLFLLGRITDLLMGSVMF